MSNFFAKLSSIHEQNTENIDSIITRTENFDKAFATTGSKCLDFFVRITRGAPIPDYVPEFFEAFNEDFDIAFKVLFNLRDIRDGKGEKIIPIVIMVCLKNTLPEDIYKLILEIYLKYGSWKDILRIVEISNRMLLEINPLLDFNLMDNNKVEFDLFANQLKIDYDLLATFQLDQTKKVAISLCGKWAPSQKCHFAKEPIFATKWIRKRLQMSPKEYRQMLSQLRAHLVVLERLMSLGQLDQINFEKIPSVAMHRMKKSFHRDTNASGIESESRKTLHKSYEEYLTKLNKGEAKVNVCGIQPHELVNTYLGKTVELDLLVEGQWTALIDRVRTAGTFKNTMAIVDTSGSMNGVPLQVAIALGIVVAECTECTDKKVITFNTTPRWHELVGSTLKEKVTSMNYRDWGGSTDLRKVFDMILEDAVSRELPPSQMITTIIIFTDMQFDSACGADWESTFEYATKQYLSHNYDLPKIVCWNLRTSCSKSLPVTKDEIGYVMLSGYSAELLKSILDGNILTPLTMMLHVLESYVLNIEQNSIPLNRITFNLDQLQIAINKSAYKKAFIAVSTDVTKPNKQYSARPHRSNK